MPWGTYQFGSKLTLAAPWIGVETTQSVRTDNNCPLFVFTGSGQAAVTRASFECLDLSSGAIGQSGLQVSHGIGIEISKVVISDFSDVSLDLGVPGKSGVYMSSIDNVRIYNSHVVTGSVGLQVESSTGTVPNSNANTIRNLTVKGQFINMVVDYGNKNTYIGGDLELWPGTTSGGMKSVITFNGHGDVWIGPYVEMVGSGFPSHFFVFGARSSSNAIRDVYVLTVNGNTRASISDSGTGNNVAILPIGRNFPQEVGENSNIQNMLPNTEFYNVRPTGLPAGWVKGVGSTGSITVDSITVNGAKHSLHLNVSNQWANVQAFVATNIPLVRGALYTFPVSDFIGKTVTAGVWCKASAVGLGHVGINGQGAATYSGSGNWEFLTASALIPSGTTEVALNMATGEHSTSTATGDVWFSQPILILGDHIPAYVQRKPLDDVDAQSAGRLSWAPPVTLADGTGTPDVSEANVFITANTMPTTITNFLNPPVGSGAQEIKLLFGDSNTTISSGTYISTKTGADETYATGRGTGFIWSGSKWIETGATTGATATKTIGNCTLTVSEGIVTSISGC